jgi:hypothetical protein
MGGLLIYDAVFLHVIAKFFPKLMTTIDQIIFGIDEIHA